MLAPGGHMRIVGDMRHSRIPIPAPLAVALSGLLMLGHATCLTGGSITVSGSDTMVILAQKWAEVYMKDHPEVKIQITGGGSGTGFAALQNRTTDIANASRQIKPAEKFGCVKAFKSLPTEYRVAMDGLYVFVNEKNPINELTLEQLAKLFNGQITNWSELSGMDAPVSLYSRENSSGTYEFFKDQVLKKQDFAASAQTLQGTAQVIQAVAQEPFGIGYGGAAYATGVKILRIKREKSSPAILPSEETITDHSYPIWRYLFVYVNPRFDTGEVGDYLNWIRSDGGQTVVKGVGYFPIPQEMREKAPVDF